MLRTQIYLSDAEAALLARAAARTGESRSALIRRAVQLQYGAGRRERRLAALRATAGAWTLERSCTGADYVDDLRPG